MRPHRRQPTRLSRPWDSPGKNTGVGCHFLLQCMKVKSESEDVQSYPTLSDPMDCSLPGSSIHGIFQAGVLEWGTMENTTTQCETISCSLLSTHRFYPLTTWVQCDFYNYDFMIDFMTFWDTNSVNEWHVNILRHSLGNNRRLYLYITSSENCS